MLQTLVFLHTTSTLQPSSLYILLVMFLLFNAFFTLSYYDQPEWVSQISIENNCFPKRV
jgi:hypothetical protein